MILVCLIVQWNFLRFNDASADQLKISVQVGKEWTQKLPQTAIWLADEKGQHLVDLFVTRFDANQIKKYNALEKLRRPEALPFWQTSKYKLLSHNKNIDALSGATPKNSFVIELTFPDNYIPGTYVIWAEFNRAFDYNSSFPKGLSRSETYYNGTSGQPSIIWKTKIKIDRQNFRKSMVLVGHGDPSGKTGTVFHDTNGITTAMDLVDNIVVTYIAVASQTK